MHLFVLSLYTNLFLLQDMVSDLPLAIEKEKDLTSICKEQAAEIEKLKQQVAVVSVFIYRLLSYLENA